jgi:hypothetical protein
MKLNRLQQVEIVCTPGDLRELAKEMEHEYKHGEGDTWRKYIGKKNFAVIFCIDGERMDSEQNVKTVMKK